MYLFGHPEKTRFDDYRSAVHDSDGLAIAEKQGPRILRPLTNPKTLQISSFVTSNTLSGFGLQQRARSYGDYEDLEAHYELRPSVWVEPLGDWPAGQVELIEIPSSYEFNDNVVAFWRPAEELPAGQMLSAAYWLQWGPPVREASLASVAETLIGLSMDHTRRLFVIDFAAPRIEQRNENWTNGISMEASASAGKIRSLRGEPNPITGGYRATFELETGGEKLSELRLVLTKSEQAISETWLYRWTE
jgi:glucans biosynthesis protein